MPQRKGETQQQYMNRLRAVRGLPPMDAGNIRQQMMEEVAGARCWIDRVVRNPESQKRAELSAFMSIFHPDVPDETVRNMMRGQG